MTKPSFLIPGLRYDDAPAAIEFLCRAFGFIRHAIHADPENPAVIHHAQLTLNGAMLMLSSARKDESASLYRWQTAREAGCVTAVLCGYVEDVDAHAAVAKAEGAEMLATPKDNEGYPGRSYSARDPEGNAWNFTNYNPFVPS